MLFKTFTIKPELPNGDDWIVFEPEVNKEVKMTSASPVSLYKLTPSGQWLARALFSTIENLHEIRVISHHNPTYRQIVLSAGERSPKGFSPLDIEVIETIFDYLENITLEGLEQTKPEELLVAAIRV